jgi:hypothetical protein
MLAAFRAANESKDLRLFLFFPPRSDQGPTRTRICLRVAHYVAKRRGSVLLLPVPYSLIPASLYQGASLLTPQTARPFFEKSNTRPSRAPPRALPTPPRAPSFRAFCERVGQHKPQLNSVILSELRRMKCAKESRRTCGCFCLWPCNRARLQSRRKCTKTHPGFSPC